MMHVFIVIIVLSTADGREAIAYKQAPTREICDSMAEQAVKDLSAKYPDFAVRGSCLDMNIEVARDA